MLEGLDRCSSCLSCGEFGECSEVWRAAGAASLEQGSQYSPEEQYIRKETVEELRNSLTECGKEVFDLFVGCECGSGEVAKMARENGGWGHMVVNAAIKEVKKKTENFIKTGEICYNKKKGKEIEMAKGNEEDKIFKKIAQNFGIAIKGSLLEKRKQILDHLDGIDDAAWQALSQDIKDWHAANAEQRNGDSDNKEAKAKKKVEAAKKKKKKVEATKKKEQKDVVVADTLLPATAEELQKFILIGKEQLKAHKAKIRAIDKIGMAVAAKEAALTDAQDLADILLDAEAKLGEILAATPDFHSSGKGTMKRKSLPNGIDKKQSHYAQKVAKAKKDGLLEDVKKRARETGDIATRKDVLSAVAAKGKAEKPREKKEEVQEKEETISTLIDEAFRVLQNLLANLKATNWKGCSRGVVRNYLDKLEETIA